MAADQSTFYTRRLGVPFVLFSFCLIALFVSLLGLFMTSSLTNARLGELQTSWQSIMQGEGDGSELLLIDRLMQGVATPLPAIESAAGWSLGMAVLSLVLLVWFVIASRRVDRVEIESVGKQARNSSAAMSRLIDEMAPLASGDLNVKATVQPGTPGALAEAFNYAVGELRRLAGSQVLISRALSETIAKSRALVTEVEKNCADQSERVLEASNSLLSLSSATGELSANATDTTVFAKTLSDRADVGSNMLQATLLRARAVSNSAGLSIKRIQSLQQQSQTINDVISPLEEVAQRTDLLAINATLGSSASNSSSELADPHPFVSQLSSELTGLSEQLGRVVFDIRSLTQAMLAESSEVLTLMQDLKKSMDEHISDADLLLYDMSDIQKDAVAMQSRAIHFAQKSVEQTGVVRDLCESMQLINRITEQVLHDVNENADSLDTVKKLSIDIRQNLTDFNLPDSHAKSAEKAMSSARQAAERAFVNV